MSVTAIYDNNTGEVGITVTGLPAVDIWLYLAKGLPSDTFDTADLFYRERQTGSTFGATFQLHDPDEIIRSSEYVIFVQWCYMSDPSTMYDAGSDIYDVDPPDESGGGDEEEDTTITYYYRNYDITNNAWLSTGQTSTSDGFKRTSYSEYKYLGSYCDSYDNWSDFKSYLDDLSITELRNHVENTSIYWYDEDNGRWPRVVFLHEKTIVNYTITYKLGLEADQWSDGTTANKTQNKTSTSSVSLKEAIAIRNPTTSTGNTYTFNGNGATTQSKTTEASLATTTYAHSSWNTNSSLTGTTYALGATYSNNSDLTLYPKFTKSTSYAQVHFPTANECNRTNYTLLGWSSSSTATSADFLPGDALAGNHTTKTWYAVWQANTYTITYDGNGIDAFDSTATYTINDTITWANPSITKEYTYIEIDADKNETSEIKSQSFSVYTWNTSANGTGTSYKPGETISGADLNSNITLFAQYRRVVVLPPVRVPGVPLISTFSTIHYDKDNNIMPNISTVPLSYKRVKTIVTKKRLVYYNWQDEDETHPYYKSLELNPPWAGINVTIPSGLPHPIDWNNVNKYCGTKQMNEFISLINKYTGSSISLLNTDDIITKSLYNQIANILNNVSDVDDKNIHYHDYDFEEANLSLLDDDTPLRKTHFTNLSHALLYLRYWEKD